MVLIKQRFTTTFDIRKVHNTHYEIALPLIEPAVLFLGLAGMVKGLLFGVCR
jgi:hypothetical protein